MAVLRQLLSRRFDRAAAGRPARPLSPVQRQYLDEVNRRFQSGEFHLQAAACPCLTSPADSGVRIAEIDRYGLPLSSVLCLACGTVRTDPYFDDASLDHFYTHCYQELYGRKKNLPQLFAYQRSHYGERIATLYASGLTAESAVLEVGCGTGGATVAFRERGCFVAGCDFSPDLVQYGTNRGLRELWTGTIDDAPPSAAARQYNLIYLFHVLEHVSAPARMLDQLRGRLAPGGRILAVVPDLSRIDVYRNPAGNALTFLHIAHKFNFTLTGLSRVSSQARLSARQIEPPPRNEAALADARHLSEMWIEFSPASVAEVEGLAPPRAGEEMLRHLLATEQLFLAGRCPAQLAIAARAALAPAARTTIDPPLSRRPRWYDRLPLVRATRRWLARTIKRAA